MAAITLAIIAGAVLAGDANTARRARPPKFSKAVKDAFFPNALDKLVGPRPDKPSATGTTTPSSTASDGPVPASRAESQFDWGPLISSDVIEDEIKAQHRELGETVANVLKFKSGDYKRTRVYLSVLATMFAIDAQHRQPIRWQRQAAAMRDRLARAGFNCKVATDASYQDAKARYDELETLIRGGPVDTRSATAEVSWDKVADRGPLMERLEQAEKQALAPWTANAGEFADNIERLSHEAQVVAALAEVIGRDGYEYADDDTYLEYAGQLRSQAQELHDAAAGSNYERARAAVGEISKTCSNCHDGYRN